MLDLVTVSNFDKFGDFNSIVPCSPIVPIVLCYICIHTIPSSDKRDQIAYENLRVSLMFPNAAVDPDPPASARQVNYITKTRM